MVRIVHVWNETLHRTLFYQRKILCGHPPYLTSISTWNFSNLKLALFSVWTPRKTNYWCERRTKEWGKIKYSRCILVIFERTDMFWTCIFERHIVLWHMTIQQQLWTWLWKILKTHTGEKVGGKREGRFSKGFWDGQGYLYLTDLCQVWWQLCWRRQQAPDWASAHRAFRTAWSCPHGSGCRCHDRQSNPRGKTPVVQGYGYLKHHGHDLAQYLLEIQLMWWQGLWFRQPGQSFMMGFNTKDVALISGNSLLITNCFWKLCCHICSRILEFFFLRSSLVSFQSTTLTLADAVMQVDISVNKYSKVSAASRVL